MAMIALLLAVMLTACVGYEGKYRSDVADAVFELKLGGKGTFSIGGDVMEEFYWKVKGDKLYLLDDLNDDSPRVAAIKDGVITFTSAEMGIVNRFIKEK